MLRKFWLATYRDAPIAWHTPVSVRLRNPRGTLPTAAFTVLLSLAECGNEKILFSCQIAEVNGELAPFQLVQTFREYKNFIYLFVVIYFIFCPMMTGEALTPVAARRH